MRRGRRLLAATIATAALLLTTTAASTVAYLRLPEPTGVFAVGRTAGLWSDPSRAEASPADTSPDGRRRVRVVAWYPAGAAADSAAGPYLRDLDAIAGGLVASGELGDIEVAGLRLVAGHAIDDAPVAAVRSTWPVVLFSPGNATNVEFYGTLAEDLASHGFVVLGVDHPYQVAAVATDDGSVAVLAPQEPAGGVPAKIDERVADLRFVLDRLAAGTGPTALLHRLDLSRVGVAGHSNGGLTAAELCRVDPRVRGCLNIDGQSAGGPLSARPHPVAPIKPFLYLTKETQLQPVLADLFEQGGQDTYRVVVPAAAHDQFTDGPRFRPRLLPMDGTPDAVLVVSRGFVRAFFDRVLRDAPVTVFRSIDAPTDVLVEVYPLRPA